MVLNEEMDDDQLLEELVMWISISRNEGGLMSKERKNFQAIVKEIKKRGLLSLKSVKVLKGGKSEDRN